MPCHKPGWSGSVIQLRGMWDRATSASEHPLTAHAPVNYPGSYGGCQRGCSRLSAKQGQDHIEKVINKENGEMGTEGKERQEGKEEKRRKREKENLMGNSINQYCVLWNVLKNSYFWAHMILSTPLSLLAVARPEYLLLYNRTTQGECNTQVFDGWIGWKFI